MMFDFDKPWNKLTKREKDRWEKLVQKINKDAQHDLIEYGIITKEDIKKYNLTLTPEDEWNGLKENYENMYRKGNHIFFNYWLLEIEDGIELLINKRR